MGSHARNYDRVARGPAGAPPALLPPYVDIPGDVSGREAASSRVSPARDPWAVGEVACENMAAGFPAHLRDVFRESFWASYRRCIGHMVDTHARHIEEALHDA